MRSTPIRRTYSSFRGVDFANDPSLVLLSRSPDALNVWKNYKDTQGSCIETRPGYRELANFMSKINGIYFYNDKALIHAGTNLFLWENFPDTPTGTMLKNNMNNAKSSFVIFNENLYIVDGANYLVYDGTTLKDVSSDSPYIPTTSISRSPSGGGEPYQDVNVLQPLRKNSFVADGTSTDYYLDTTEIDSITEVKVNDTVVTNYTVNATAGKVSFTTAPSAPTLSGTDNVEITFSKAVPGYIDRISKCTKMVVFDRRLFFTGNPDYPNAIFHSQLNTPNYVSDLAYYQDGTDESDIKALVVGNNILWVFKEPSQERDTIFYHTATTDSIGKVYPNFQGNVSTGCYSDAINYKDDIVFLSKTGLEGISSNDIASQQLLSHKSSLVDNRLVNENNFDLSMMTEWNGYLVILVNSHIYLGDIRQLYQSINGYEYEWYYWEIENTKATILKEYKGNLYIGTRNGSIFIVEGTNDNGEIIESYWTTPMDNFGYENKYKTTNKRGGVAKVKTMANGQVKVAERTNKENQSKFIKDYSTNRLDFERLDFSNFTFDTTNSSNIVYKIKEKKFAELQLKFYNDELDKPFGIYNSIIEAFEGGYIKR
jgi:hypothetical protein